MFKHTRDGYPESGEIIYATHKEDDVSFDDFTYATYYTSYNEDDTLFHNLEYGYMAIDGEHLEFMYITEEDSIKLINNLLNKET